MRRSGARALSAALLTLACGLTTVPAGSPAGADDGSAARPVEGWTTSARAASSVRFTGSGYGHGHGLSQYGAYGAASQGRTYRQILAFYYPGLKRGRVGGDVSVLITADTSPDLVVSDRSRLTAKSVGRSNTVKLAKKQARQWRITSARAGTRSVVAWRGSSGGWHSFRTLPGQAQVHAGGRPITLHTPAGRVAYRGVLRSVKPRAESADSPSDRDTLNVVSLDDYVKGVVPNEVPASWPKHAVRAQAVAARTYAAFERAASDPDRHYQLCDTSLCQVYGGYSSENPLSNDAVSATAHEALLKGGEPAFTQFSASNGGWTAAGSFGYLPAKKDPYDTAYVGWRATVGAATLRRAAATYRGTDIGTFRRVQVVERDGNGRYGGRVERVRIIGSRASATLTGDELRVAAGLMSTLFKVG